MTKTAKIITVLAAVAAIVSGVLYGKGLLNVHQGAVKPASLAVLEPQKEAKAAPAVTFTDIRGGRHALADFKGRYVLLNLWATWCAPCVSELPALARLKTQVPGLAVLAVNIWKRDKPADIDAFLKGHDAAALGTLTDADVTLTRAFGATVFPTTVLIDPKGDVVARAEGPAEWATPEAVDYFKALTGG
jgi:thiol-disulfide isomerase/thioredoxin